MASNQNLETDVKRLESEKTVEVKNVESEKKSSDVKNIQTPAAPEKKEAASISAVPRKVTLKTSGGDVFEVEECVAREMKTVDRFLGETDGSSSSEGLCFTMSSSDAVTAEDLAVILEYLNKAREIRGRGGAAKEVAAYGMELAGKRRMKGGEIMSTLLAANYLEQKEFMDILSQSIANRMANKSVEFVRTLFSLDNDYTEEEEKEIRAEVAWSFEDVVDDED